MEVFLENFISYSILIVVSGLVIYFYTQRKNKSTKLTEEKISKAKEDGLFEPVSLHPVINLDTCIGSGACVSACPEKDILGLKNGKASVINASRCVGHGACFNACPVQAITLCIGTEKRGVELPHVNSNFETNIPMVFVAGEIGGMGLIKNAVEQGKQAVNYIVEKLNREESPLNDLIIIGAGPAGISASLQAKRNNLNFLIFEQATIGGTVANFPRQKIVMTSPMDLPLHGKVKLFETSKSELIELWDSIIKKNNITINQQEKVISINKEKSSFFVETNKGKYESKAILIAIGRRGSPRKLGVPGEEKEKVFYRLLEPELIRNSKILVVGGGDSAIESALLLAQNKNEVTVSYRNENFSRLKPMNVQRINEAVDSGRIQVVFNSNVVEIKEKSVLLKLEKNESEIEIENDLVFVFAGGELPTKFLENVGISITKKFGEPLLSNSKN